MLEGFDVTRGIRLLGVSASQLLDPPPTQGVLVLDGDHGDHVDHVDRIAAVERAADTVRDRFGDSLVRPAALLDRRRGDDT